jgi:hypothetical protein
MFEARLARQDRRLAEEFLQEMDWDESRDGPIRTQYTESYWIENLLWALAPNSLSNFIWGNTGNEHEARDLEDGHGPNLEQRSSAPVGSPTRNSQFVEDVNASAADLEVEDENDKVFICLVEKASSSGRPSNWRLTHAKMNRKSRSSAQLDIPAGSIVSENTLANPQGMDKALFQALREKLLRRQKSRSWRWLLPKMISAFEFWEVSKSLCSLLAVPVLTSRFCRLLNSVIVRILVVVSQECSL